MKQGKRSLYSKNPPFDRLRAPMWGSNVYTYNDELLRDKYGAAYISSGSVVSSARRARDASADMRRSRIFEALRAFQQGERRLPARALPAPIRPAAL